MRTQPMGVCEEKKCRGGVRMARCGAAEKVPRKRPLGGVEERVCAADLEREGVGGMKISCRQVVNFL